MKLKSIIKNILVGIAPAVFMFFGFGYGTYVAYIAFTTNGPGIVAILSFIFSVCLILIGGISAFVTGLMITGDMGDDE